MQPTTGADVTTTVVSTVDLGNMDRSVSFGRLGASAPSWVLPVHPSNSVLFPNLAGIWQHYERFAIPRMRFSAAPVASVLSPGAIAQAVLTPQEQLSVILPSFSALLNYASTAVWPVAR